MSSPYSSRPPRVDAPAAGETSSPGQSCNCGHLDVSHGFARDNRTRTACSVSSGPKATPWGCKTFTAVLEPLNPKDPS